MLEVEGLSMTLGDFKMRDVSFSVAEGEYFVLLGASGTGKTVLLEALVGIQLPDSGRVLLRGRDITRERLRKRSIGIVFQDRALFPHMSVGRNIAFGPASAGAGGRELRDAVDRIARETGVEHLLRRMPATLSGGEAQRVALARALATGPDCLLLDEPLSSLDTAARAGIRALLRRLNRGGKTILHVTHDYEEAVSLATKMGIMENGTIVQVDSPDRILMHPRSEFVARFVGIRNMYRGRLSKSDGDTARFAAPGIELEVLTDAPERECVVLIRSEDVTISTRPGSTSARNVFHGTIVDLVPARLGVEVIVDAGIEIVALVTSASAKRLALRRDMQISAAVKASAVRILDD